ncbi:hypothetical protein M1D30_03560 [Prevotella sp. E15-22]|uniref:hypothetical protein n=1 Tax=Prevotella sp. E15-22 TaxID=2937774 RepID=UPI00205EB60B|nr:hypothetical protein [Prevotella sp. E15-22]UPS45260.1 hypothetical protein M1D30_03560 [Prevotella sp. E15-22]
MNDFEKYKIIKEQYDIEYNGYKLNRILALVLWSFANDHMRFRYRAIAKLFLSYNFNNLFYNSSAHQILSTFGTYNRKDHLETYENVLSMLGPFVSKNILINPKLRFCFSIRSFLFSFKNWKSRVWQLNNYTKKSKIALLIETVFWCNNINSLSRKDFVGVNKYLSFCDALDLENLLTQHFKRLGVPTYSMTHGCHHISHKSPEPGMIDYENLETDNLLMWGKYSINEYVSWGIDTKKLLLAGYPKSNKLVNYRKKEETKRCIVFLSQHYFFNQNMQLLNIISKFTDKFEFTIKPHPAAVEYYFKFINENGMKMIPSNETIENCLTQEKYDWAIAVNTNAYYEALMRGVICLRYNDGSFDLMPGCDDVFENPDQFEMKIIERFGLSQEEYQKEINDVLEYTMGVGINNYRKIIVGS